MMSTDSRPSAATSASDAQSGLLSKDDLATYNHNNNTNAAVPRDLSRSGASYEATRESPERKRQRHLPETESHRGVVSVSRSQTEHRHIDDVDENDQLEEELEPRKPASSSSDIRVSGESEHIASKKPPSTTHTGPGRGTSAALDPSSRYEFRDGSSMHRTYFDRRSEAGETIASRSEQNLRPHRMGSYNSDQQYAEMDRRDRTYKDVADQGPISHRMPPPPMMDTHSPSISSRLPGMHQRAGSPPPQLPGFASLSSEGTQMHHRDDAGGPKRPFPTSPHRSMQSSFRPLPYANYPSSSSRPPIEHHPYSGPPGIYGNPPMIHPSLAGLPGAGGGPGGKQQPSFVSKLYSMLEDPSISDLISWGHTGTVFSVSNPTEFSRLVLPNWFKHSNWQSFVRQLNMYGFHKVNHSYQGNPNDEVQVWEFRHPSFRRGEIALLNDIKRKSSRQKRSGSPRGSVSGADLRAERSGGSTSPSPEVSIAPLPSGPEATRTEMGMHRVPREFAYGDERVGSLAFDRRPDPRSLGFEYDRVPVGHFGGGGDLAYARVKAEEAASGISRAASALPAASGQDYARDDAIHRRRFDSFIDRDEMTARFDDLSERTDAIIRHSSFLESQVRVLSEQLAETRAKSRQLVQDEILQLLDRLERSLGAPAQPGVDANQRILEVVRNQLAYYSKQYNFHEHPRLVESLQQGGYKRPSM